MADYAVGRTGGSLRDALNSLYPMTGLGEYSTQFPPQTGAPQPGPPVPIPQPRPPMAGPQYLPPPGAALAAAPPTPVGRPPVAPPLPMQANLGLAGPPRAPTVGGGVSLPLNPNLALRASGQYGQLGPGDYAARLGLTGRF